jgi:tetratricopeptide (TPR) repeat protein
VAVALQSRSRILLLSAGPVLGATVGAITNVLTSHWNWWLFGTLTVLVGAGAAIAVMLGVQTGTSGDPRNPARSLQWRSRRRRRSTTINTLPRDINDFTGREEILARLLTAIRHVSVSSGHQITVHSIEGMGGVGKTSLAVHIAHQIARDQLDAVLFIDLRAHVPDKEPLSTHEALGILLADIGVPGQSIPDNLEGRASYWRRELTDARVLVVLDNASGSDQVRDLLAGGADCCFLITSRRRLVELEGVSSLPLDTFSPSEAAALFTRVLGTERAVGQEADIVDVVRRLSYLPLAIRLTAARLRAHPTWAIRDIMERDIRQESGLEGVYNLSFRDLTSRQKEFFKLLSIHPALDITAEAAAVLTSTSRDESIEILDELYSRYLVEEPLPHRFKLHDLIKEFANREASTMGNEVEQREAVLKLLSYDTFIASTASKLIGAHDIFDTPNTTNDAAIHPPSNETEALAWFDAELGNLLACAHYANDKELLPFAWQLPASMMSYLRLRGFTTQIVSLLDGALHAVTHIQDKVGESHIRRRIGHISRLQGDFEVSRINLQKSLDFSKELDDRQSFAWCHHELGHLDRVTNHPAAAREHLTTAIATHRQLGNQTGVMTGETGLAIVLHASGETIAAREYFRDAIRIAIETADRRAQAFALFQLGVLERDTGEYETARGLLTDAFAIYDAAGNRAGQADCYLNIATIDRLNGHYEEARRNLSKALNIYVELGYRRGEADTYHEFAATTDSAGDSAMSMVYRERAATIYAELQLIRSPD